jgi:hypothetical protein
MHTSSTRIPFALAFDRGEESGPRDPIAPHLLEMLSLIEQGSRWTVESRQVGGVTAMG